MREISHIYSEVDYTASYKASSETLFHYTITPGLEWMVTLRGFRVMFLLRSPQQPMIPRLYKAQANLLLFSDIYPTISGQLLVTIWTI